MIHLDYLAVALSALALACGSEPAPTTHPLANTSPPSTGSAEPAGCNDAHGCLLRGVCGCSCEGVLLSTPRAVTCEESCPNPEPCAGYSVICDLGTHRCGAIPKQR